MNIHASRARAVRIAVAFYKARLKACPKSVSQKRSECVRPNVFLSLLLFFLRFRQFAILALDRNFSKLFVYYADLYNNFKTKVSFFLEIIIYRHS